MTFMQRKKFQPRVWLMRFLILIGCLVGVGFWLAVDSTGSFPTPLRGEITLPHADEPGSPVSRPEIDIQTPETTEIALFALG